MAEGSDSKTGGIDPGVALLTRIGDFVEPLTRFDRGHLTLENSQHVLIDVAARQTFRVVFDTVRSEGNGGLPEGVTHVEDAAALIRESEAQFAAARAVVPARLAHWTEEHGEDPRARPTIDDCTIRIAPIGHVDACVPCSGSGKIACPLCHAAGTLTCEACAGRGSTSCTTCNAAGEMACKTCKGMGTVLTQKEKKVWDDAIDNHRIEHVQELAPCAACSGSGKLKCARCGGATTITCAACHGQKTIPCTQCKGSGSSTCQTCGGEGKRFHTVTLNCAIRETYEAAPRTAEPDVAAVLKSLSGLEQILDLSSSHRATAETNADTLRRDTLAVVPVTTVTVQIGGNHAQVRGFGPKQDVLDYSNIAGLLLSDDIAMLEQVLPTTKLFPPKVNDELHAALSNVLASEVNAEIAAKSGRKDGGGIDKQFRGVVSADYLKRASAAMRTSLTRSYWAIMARGPIAVLAAPILYAPLDLLVRGQGENARTMSLIGVMLLTFGLAIGAHIWCGRQMQARIRPNGVPKFFPLLNQANLTRDWLMAAAASAIVLTLLVSFLIRLIAPASAPPTTFPFPLTPH